MKNVLTPQWGRYGSFQGFGDESLPSFIDPNAMTSGNRVGYNAGGLTSISPGVDLTSWLTNAGGGSAGQVATQKKMSTQTKLLIGGAFAAGLVFFLVKGK